MEIELIFAILVSRVSIPATLSVTMNVYLASILLGIATILFLCMVVVGRTRMTALQSVLYYISYVMTISLWRCRSNRLLPRDPGQGAVIVTNHRSSVDPFFIQMAVGPEIVHWMVAKEFVEHPAFRWFLRTGEVIPTNRAGIDTASTKQAIRYAENGELVGMLPEGRINMSEDFLLPVRPGAALIALHARVPLIPCYIEGAPYNKLPHSPFLMFARVRVRVGAPIDMSAYYGQENEHEIANKVTLQAMKAIAALADHENFDPKLAGRRWKPTRDELEAAMAESDRRRHKSGSDA